MPIYEYRCKDCKRKSSFLIYNYDKLKGLRCKHCDGENLIRIYSRFAAIRSEDSKLERLADPSTFSDIDEKDPRSVAKWMKKMSKEMGEDLGSDFDEEIEKAIEEEGKSSEERTDDEI